MATVTIVERGCRGCTLCVDTCPVQVFEHDAARDQAVVRRPEDCIGCLSCVYVCPSRCVDVGEVENLRPFHRIEENVALVERFLQEPTVSRSLSSDDWEEARRDVAARLNALAHTVVETMGRGHKPVGRRAGTLAAAHMPEMYEEHDLSSLLAALQQRFGAAFALSYALSDTTVDLTFSPCGLCAVVEAAGEKVGEAVLCELFHEYLAALVGSFAGSTYRFELPQAGATCRMTLTKAR